MGVSGGVAVLVLSTLLLSCFVRHGAQCCKAQAVEKTPELEPFRYIGFDVPRLPQPDTKHATLSCSRKNTSADAPPSSLASQLSLDLSTSPPAYSVD